MKIQYLSESLSGFILLLFATSLPAAANTWLGTADNSWHIGGDWSDPNILDAVAESKRMPWIPLLLLDD
jgi:hypothetical protein